MLNWLRLITKREQAQETPADVPPTAFEERHVPLEIRHFGVVRSYRPVDGRDFRVLLDQDGKWSVFPKTKLTAADKEGIILLMQSQEGAK